MKYLLVAWLAISAPAHADPLNAACEKLTDQKIQELLDRCGDPAKKYADVDVYFGHRCSWFERGVQMSCRGQKIHLDFECEDTEGCDVEK